MACVLIAFLVFPVVAASVISSRVTRHLREKGDAWATSIGVITFIASFVALFFLTAYILTAKFRLVR